MVTITATATDNVEMRYVAIYRGSRQLARRDASAGQTEVSVSYTEEAVLPSRFIKSLQVVPGFDVADNEIVKRLAAGDLVITSDIPLAAEVIAKDGHALSPRGERFTRENVRARLNIRDFMDTMRASGIQTGGPPPLNQTDRKAFADQLDRILTRHATGSR